MSCGFVSFIGNDLFKFDPQNRISEIKHFR